MPCLDKTSCCYQYLIAEPADVDVNQNAPNDAMHQVLQMQKIVQNLKECLRKWILGKMSINN